MAKKKVIWLSIIFLLLKHYDLASASTIRSYSGTIIEAKSEEKVDTDVEIVGNVEDNKSNDVAPDLEQDEEDVDDGKKDDEEITNEEGDNKKSEEVIVDEEKNDEDIDDEKIVDEENDDEKIVDEEKDDEDIVDEEKDDEGIVDEEKDDEEIVEEEKDDDEIVDEEKGDEEIVDEEKDDEEIVDEENEDEEIPDEEKDDEEIVDEEKDDEEIPDEEKDDEEIVDEDKDDEEIIDEEKDDEEIVDEDKDDEEIVDDEEIPGERPPSITIDQGDVQGVFLKNRNDINIFGYLSIPYAKPPLGELRFQDPQPADDMGERNSEDLPICAQVGSDVGTEDCLYLNVYTPEFDPEEEPQLKPVMVYIHGGNFDAGSGRAAVFDPRYLLTEDIVLVVINYRLGIFGFFNLEDGAHGTPGNAGLKDQAMALKWVQKNIEQFRGDPENVCLVGQSAGAASVHLHLLSPLSAGLFSKAIIQSGTALSPWIYGERDNGIELAEHLEISTEDIPAMLEELRGKSTEEILTAFVALSSKERDNWITFAAPIIEAGDSDDSFLRDDPFDIIRGGEYNDVPIMIGSTDAEGIFLTPVLAVPEFTLDVTSFVPNDLGIKSESETAANLVARIQQFYFGDSEPSVTNVAAFIRLVTDVFFSFPAYRSALEHSRTSEQPIYYYKFSADTKLNVHKLGNPNTATLVGASHSDDLGYLFYNSQLPPASLGDEEIAALERVVQLWTSFVKTGVPSASVQDPATTDGAWIPFETETANYADIGTTETVAGVDPNEEAMVLWGAIYDEFFRDSDSAVSLQLSSIILALCLAVIQIVYNYN